LDLLILGTSFWKETIDTRRRSVYDVEEAIEIKNLLRAKKMYLTHMSHDINRIEHSKMLLPQINFAFDGLEINL
jgi:phosphoribosyl 1,2-cyclic phosphate phosphodiesterase